LVGTAIFWSPTRAQSAGKRSVVWKAFTPPPKAVAASADAAAVERSRASETSSLLSPVVIRTVRPAGKTISKSTKTSHPVSGGPAADPLGPRFVDADRGFSMRFPNRWSIRTSSNKHWVLDCGNGREGVISVGLTTSPPGWNAQTLTSGWVSRQIEKRDGATAQSQGSATIAGRKAFWSKSTTAVSAGKAGGRMTRISYVLALPDGRLAEIRVAATPEAFESASSVMKQAVATFRPTATPSKREAVTTTE
jgi:hypothetical protein